MQGIQDYSQSQDIFRRRGEVESYRGVVFIMEEGREVGDKSWVGIIGGRQRGQFLGVRLLVVSRCRRWGCKWGFFWRVSVTLEEKRVEEISKRRSQAIRRDSNMVHRAFSLIYWHSLRYSYSIDRIAFSDAIVVKNSSLTLVPPI